MKIYITEKSVSFKTEYRPYTHQIDGTREFYEFIQHYQVDTPDVDYIYVEIHIEFDDETHITQKIMARTPYVGRSISDKIRKMIANYYIDTYLETR